jgi:hypothetical protein
MSYDQYKKFLDFEDMYWELQAQQARKGGFLSKEESKDFLNSILEG